MRLPLRAMLPARAASAQRGTTNLFRMLVNSLKSGFVSRCRMKSRIASSVLSSTMPATMLRCLAITSSKLNGLRGSPLAYCGGGGERATVGERDLDACRPRSRILCVQRGIDAARDPVHQALDFGG